MPFGGYRVGSSGAAGSAVVAGRLRRRWRRQLRRLVDVPYGPPQNGLKFEALFSHERSWIEVQGSSLFDPKTKVDVTVDHLMVGGVQDSTPLRAAHSSAACLG